MSAENPPDRTPASAATTAATAAQIVTLSHTMLWGGLWPGLAAGVVATIVAGVLAGIGGVGAAALGTVLVLAVCALSPLVMRWTAGAEPLMVMGIAMISFVTKLGLLLGLFLVIGRLGLVDTRVLALATGAVALVYIAGEVVAFARARTPTVVSG